MEDPNNQLSMFSGKTELVLDEPPASVTMMLGGNSEKAEQLAAHRLQMASIRKQYPHPAHPYKIGVYIRSFNQTKYENYLALCPKWTLVDLYIDEGQTAPYMENAPEWTRLLNDCFSGKIDLIITQKVSNVVRKDNDKQITFLASILAAQEHPVGIYFVSENIFTLATYYTEDLFALDFFPEGQKQLCDGEPIRGISE